MAFKLEWKDRVVVFEYSGEVTSEDILESNQFVYGDHRFDALRWQLVFFDEVSVVNFNERDVKKIAFCDKAAFVTNSRIQVLFVGKTELVREMYTLYESFVGESFWPTIYLEERKDAWNCLRELSGDVAF